MGFGTGLGFFWELGLSPVPNRAEFGSAWAGGDRGGGSAVGSQHDGVCRTPSVRESLGRVSPPALEEARWAGWAGGQGSLLCQLGMGTELSPLPLFGVPPLGGGSVTPC